MAKAATGKTNNPTTARKALSHKHVKGQHGTPYSQCVSGAAKLLNSQRQTADDTSAEESSTTA